jgi:hypothetical protein
VPKLAQPQGTVKAFGYSQRRYVQVAISVF